MWLFANIAGLVTRARAEGGTCLKTAAAVVETGDLSVVVKTIWKGDETDRERLIKKVMSVPFASKHILTHCRKQSYS